MKNQLSKYSTFILIVIGVFCFKLIKAQNQCPTGYEERDVMCNDNIVKKCIPVNFTCKDCWIIQWQNCDGNKWVGLAWHSTYEKCLEDAESTKNGHTYHDCPELLNKYVYRIYLKEAQFCNSNPCAGTNIQQKDDLSKNATIMIIRFRREISDASNGEYTTGKVFEEYKGRLNASEELVKKFETAFNNTNDKCLDEIQKAYDAIQQEETKFKTYTANYESQKKSEINQAKQDSINKSNQEKAADQERIKKQQQINQQNQQLNQQLGQNQQLGNTINQSIQTIGNIILDAQNAKFQSEMSSFEERAKNNHELTTKVMDLSWERRDSAEQNYQKGNYDLALQNWMEQLYFEVLQENQEQMVNFYVLSRNKFSDCTTGEYILFKAKNSHYSIDNADNFKFIELEKFILPDVFRIPICKVFDGKQIREYNYQHAFSYINDCKICKSVYVELSSNSGFYSIDCQNKANTVYNLDSSLYLMEQNILNPKINNTIDLLDYTSTYLWYNCLKLKNAKTINDLINQLQTNKSYFEMASSISKYSGSLAIYESAYWKQANKIGNYYTLMACGKLYDYANASQKKNIGEIGMKLTGIYYNFLGNGRYETNSKEQIKTMNEISSLISDLTASLNK